LSPIRRRRLRRRALAVRPREAFEWQLRGAGRGSGFNGELCPRG
jgi:hypothetical protein